MTQLPGAFAVDPSDPLPIYAQLERGIRSAIAVGRISPGSQLPTVRQLAVELRINANTVARVYTELERLGVLEARRGVGTFVRRALPEAAPNRRDRERELRALADRVLADAAAAGFGADELIKHLAGRTRKERST
jgi:GntR family transcriptional regulator